MYCRVMLTAAMVSLVSLYGQAIAEDKASPKANREEVTTEVKASEAGQSKKAIMVLRATEINGMKVRNQEGKEIGTVKDTVIDVQAGEIKYAALSYGGFLGVGDKLFAVPWDAFSHRHNVGDDEHFLSLNVGEETLKNAPGFNQDTWPNFADAKFSGGIDTYYAKYRQNKPATDEPKPRGSKPDEGVSLASHRIHRASALMDMNVRNASGVKLGEVDDLVIEVDTGKVRYAALSYGGFLGVGDKLFAVPWNAFKVDYNTSEKEYFLVVNLDEATLRKASGFNKDAWPNFADPKISNEIDKYYERTNEGREAAKASGTR